MNLNLSKNMLLFLALCTAIIIISFIHNTIMANTLDDKLKKLHASGVYIEMLDQKNNIFSSKRSFVIRLDKVDLIAELLFGIQSNDPLMVHFSKFQGLKLNIELSHTKFIFSNNLSMYISMNTLPEYFHNQSLLFNDMLEFSKANPYLIETSFNVWDYAFTFNIPNIQHSFAAEHNISYHVDIQGLELQGYVQDHTNFDINYFCESLNVSLKEKNHENINLNIKNTLFNVSFLDKDLDSTLNIDQADMNFSMSENISLHLEGFQTTQSFIRGSTVEINSVLELNALRIQEDKELFYLEGVAYDLAISNLDPKTVAHIKELIHTSNIHTIAFIYDDLSDDIASLVKHEAQIELDNFSFEDLYLYGNNYKDARLSLHAYSQPENIEKPMQFYLNLHLSKPLYQAFLDKVPNASLAQAYLPDSDPSIDFALELTDKGLRLNDHELLFDPVLIMNSDSNTSDENNHS